MSVRPDPLDPVEAAEPLSVTPAEVVDLIDEAAERLADMLPRLVSAGGARTR